MKNNRQSYPGLLIICFIGGLLLSRCEIASDQGAIDHSVNESFEAAMNEAKKFISSDPEEAVLQLGSIAEDAKSASATYAQGKALWYQGWIYDKKLENVSKAYFAYREAIKHLDRTDDTKYRFMARNNLAILNQYYGHHEAAIDIYLETLKYKEDLKPEFISDLYFNLGRSYKLVRTDESFTKAEEAFTRSMDIAVEADYHENIASVNNQVGTMYKDLKNYDIARIAYQNTIRTYQSEHSDSDLLDYVGKAYHGIGVTYMEEENYAQAISSFTKALEYEQVSQTIFITKYDLGTVLNKAGQTEEAIATWKDALSEKHNRNDRIQVEIYSKLTSALALDANYEEAVMYAQIYNQHIGNILSIGETYETKNNKVIFADIVREYAEFNRTVPFYKEPWALVLMFIFIALAVYTGSHAYYQSKLSTKVSDARSEIQVEFQNIKID